MDQSEAFSTFRDWLDKSTRLRVDCDLAVINFCFDCTLSRVEEPLITLLLSDRGSLSLKFDETWSFRSTAPDAEVHRKDRLGRSASDTRQYEFGRLVLATRETGSTLLLIEVVREILT